MSLRTVLALTLGLLASPVVLAAPKTETLKVTGWHSKGDAYKTEAAVRAVKGVTSASADEKSGTVSVTYEDSQATRQQLEKAVASAGYAVAK